MTDADMQSMVYELFGQILAGWLLAWGSITIVNFFSDVTR